MILPRHDDIETPLSKTPKARRYPRLAAVATAALLAFSGCNPQQEAKETDTILIGEFASLTGSNASFGTNMHKGIQFALDEVNEAGGVLNRKLELLVEDNQSRAGETSLVVEKLITRNKVVAIVGEVASSRSMEAAPVCQDARIPMITPASTNPAVTETGDYVFRVCFIDPFQGTVMGKFALNSLKTKRVALLIDVKQDYSVGLSQYFVEYFTANGGTIVADLKYGSGDKDFRAQLTAIKGANPDALFLPGYYTESALIIRQARELGIDIPILGGDGWDGNTFIEVAGDALKDTYYSNHFSPEDQTPHIQEFVTRFRNRFGHTPDAWSALGYDSIRILAQAMERAGTTESKALRDAIAATKDFQGITGLITIDQHRNANKPAVILKYENGAYTYAETVAP